MTTVGPQRGTCLVCGLSVPVVNYAVEQHGEVGYLARHWRPGIARTSKCRGSFGAWVERRRLARGQRPEPAARRHSLG